MLSFQEEQEAAFKQGLLPVARYDDVLGKSLSNPEHSGRVRGVGGLIPMTKTYRKCSTRKTRPPSTSEQDFDARVEQKVEERVAILKEEMKSELAILLAKAMGQQEPAFTPTVVQSSCQSVKPVIDLTGVAGVMQIQIYFPLHVLVSYILLYSSKYVYLYRSQN